MSYGKSCTNSCKSLNKARIVDGANVAAKEVLKRMVAPKLCTANGTVAPALIFIHQHLNCLSARSSWTCLQKVQQAVLVDDEAIPSDVDKSGDIQQGMKSPKNCSDFPVYSGFPVLADLLASKTGSNENFFEGLPVPEGVITSPISETTLVAQFEQ